LVPPGMRQPPATVIQNMTFAAGRAIPAPYAWASFAPIEMGWKRQNPPPRFGPRIKDEEPQCGGLQKTAHEHNAEDGWRWGHPGEGREPPGSSGSCGALTKALIETVRLPCGNSRSTKQRPRMIARPCRSVVKISPENCQPNPFGPPLRCSTPSDFDR